MLVRRRIDRRKRPIHEINVVPYIDVMLVLLVIFMVTAPFLTQGVQVDLPRAPGETVRGDDGRPPLVVVVETDGELFIERGAERTETMTVPDLAARVAATLRNEPGVSVLVKGNRHVAYGEVVLVMSALQRAGVPGVGLMTETGETTSR